MRFLVIFFIFFTISSCDSKFEYSIDDIDNYQFERIDIKELVNRKNFYDNKYIEVEGFFYGGVNHVSIHEKKKSSNGLILFSGKQKLFNQDRDLLNDDSISPPKIYEFNQSYVLIKGKYKKDIAMIGFENGGIEIMYFGNK